MLNERDKKILLFRSRFLKQKDYWIRKLSGEFEPTDILFDFDNVYPVEADNGEIEILFPVELAARVMKLSKGSDLSIYIILLTVLKTLIYRYTSNEDIIIISPIDTLKITGETINTLLFIRDRVEAGLTFKELLFNVRQSTLEAYENQDYPYDKLLEYLFSSAEERNRRAISDIRCSMGGIHDDRNIEKITTGLSFHFVRDEDLLRGYVSYTPGVFKKTELLIFSGHFIRLLTMALENIDAGISAISFLTDEEKRQLLLDFNDNKADFRGDKTIVHFIEEQAEISPNTTCLRCLDGQITYRFLNETASRWAYFLKQEGVETEAIVGINMERSIEMVIRIFGILKAGAAYMPFDPTYPQERIDYMLKDSGAKLIVGNRLACSATSCHHSSYIIHHPGNLAYVIYTSGSTGKPKGAMIEHIGMMNHIAAKIKDLQLTRESIIAQNASHTFDISVWQFFASLTVGGKTVIFPDEWVFEPDMFISWIIRERVTILEVVPSYLSVMLDFLDSSHKKFDSLRYLLVTGETVTSRLVKRWFEKYPEIKMVNAYGPTEASDDITHFVMDRAPGGDRVLIGKPLRNFDIYIVEQVNKRVIYGFPHR